MRRQNILRFKLSNNVHVAAKTVKNIWIGYYQNETIWNQEEIEKVKVSCYISPSIDSASSPGTSQLFSGEKLTETKVEPGDEATLHICSVVWKTQLE